MTFGERVLTPIVASLMRHNPRLTVQLSLCNRYVDIVDEGFDVAIRQSASLASSLVARKLCEVESVICAAPAYIKERGAPKEPADLSQHECVLYRSSLETFDSWHFQHPKRGAIRIKVESRLYVDSTSALREAVLSGAGIGLFPLYAVSAEIARGSLVALFGNLPVEPSLMHVVYPHRRYLSNKVRVFVDFLIANIELPTLRGSRASEDARN